MNNSLKQSGLRWIGRVCYVGSVLLLSAVVLGSFLKVGMNEYPPAMFLDMVDGTAHKPFVTRALAPFLIRSLEKAVPESVKGLIAQIAEHPLMLDVFGRYRWETEYAVAYFCAAAVFYVSLLLFIHAFICFAKTQYRMNPLFLRIISLFALLMLPCCFRYYSHIYDFPHLALFTYALALLASRRWVAYFCLLPLVVFSKETAVLLIMIYAVHYRGKWKTVWYWSGLCVQSIIFLLVRAFIAYLFRDNPGAQLEFHLGHNLTLDPYGFGQFGVLVGIVILCARNWFEKPKFLRDAVWMLVPMLVPAVLFGLFDEYRAFYEAWPVILLLSCYPIAEYLNIKPLKVVEKPLHNFSQI